MLIKECGTFENPWEVGFYIPQNDTGTGEGWDWETVAAFPTLVRAAGFLHFLNGGGVIDIAGFMQSIGAPQ